MLDKCIPKNYRAYTIENSSIRQHSIIRKYLVYEDWLFGAAQFYKKECIKKYLNIIAGLVKYCEDVITLLMFIDNVSYVYVTEPILLYEYGTGISTSGTKSNKIRIAIDQMAFCDIICSYSPQYKSIAKRRKKRIYLTITRKRTFKRLINEFFLMPDYGIYKIIERMKK